MKPKILNVNTNGNNVPEEIFDIFVIGGGVNGCGIARDAAGRGLRVGLAEMNDLASATSSASTKLFHGGLRYLEYYKFRLVREALVEREVLLRNMPHISWPMRFVLPLHKDMRPAWLIRLGLFMYDHMGGRKILPPTKVLDLTRDEAGMPLKENFKKAFEYSDCWVQDSRLVVLNAADARARGAEILTRTKVIAAKRRGSIWEVELDARGVYRKIRTKALVNAAGPWVGHILHDTIQIDTFENVRLVRGSHIVVKKIFDHPRAYFFQGADNRIIFAIPYEEDFTLIGTTDHDQGTEVGTPVCTAEEADYLRQHASEYFAEPIKAEDVVWSYSGVRPLYDDGVSSATEATRDYVLSLNEDGAPLLSIFGGKITTYRRLAEAVLAKLETHLEAKSAAWTANAPLPGGDFPHDGVAKLMEDLQAGYPFLSEVQARRMIRTYGTNASKIMGGARTTKDLGEDFGAGLSESEVQWLIDEEFSETAEDILWRRTRLGLHMRPEQVAQLESWLAGQKGRGAKKNV
ncbi:MAG: glycerol-3-phosphate dehydrogenase [Rhodobacteraceae bacterium]|nr:glycerol-3-phosphate dehydrogenase [Paracoccaceae bacterium]